MLSRWTDGLLGGANLQSPMFLCMRVGGGDTGELALVLKGLAQCKQVRSEITMITFSSHTAYFTKRLAALQLLISRRPRNQCRGDLPSSDRYLDSRNSEAKVLYESLCGSW